MASLLQIPVCTSAARRSRIGNERPGHPARRTRTIGTHGPTSINSISGAPRCALSASADAGLRLLRSRSLPCRPSTLQRGCAAPRDRVNASAAPVARQATDRHRTHGPERFDRGTSAVCATSRRSASARRTIAGLDFAFGSRDRSQVFGRSGPSVRTAERPPNGQGTRTVFRGQWAGRSPFGVIEQRDVRRSASEVRPNPRGCTPPSVFAYLRHDAARYGRPRATRWRGLHPATSSGCGSLSVGTPFADARLSGWPAGRQIAI